ncbi:MAG: NAD(P)-dependent alcohol dehydrogenase, partial [Acidimicrobiia bacterium]
SMAAQTALQGLRDSGQIRPGHKVLINGASGGVGTYAVQLGKWFGAEVTGVCSTRNVEMVESLGADRVVDYTKEDFTQGNERYDLVFDLIGNHTPSAYRRILTPQGRFVASFGQPENLWLGPFGFFIGMRAVSLFGERQMVLLSTRPNSEDLRYLSDLIEKRALRPVIDRSYALHQVPEAIDYLALGHARGKVVITV